MGFNCKINFDTWEYAVHLGHMYISSVSLFKGRNAE